MAGGRLSWTHRRFCAIDGRAVAHSSYFPLGGYLSTFLSVMPPVMRLHLIGAVFCDGRGQIGLTHRRSCAFDGRAVACLSYSPFRWLSTHRPSRDAAHDALHLIGAFFLNGRGRVELDAPTFLCFRRTCGGALFLLPLSVAIYSTFLPVMPPMMRLHLIGAVFCDGRGQIGLAHRHSCAFDGRAVACFSYSPSRWLSTAPSSP